MFWLIHKALAATVAASTTINPNLPGPYAVSGAAGKGPVAIIANIYYFALAASGMLAFGVIVWAGIKWTASRGNSGEISDAKDMIQSALWGLVLLVSAFVLLNTINPELAILRIPRLSELPEGNPNPAGDPNAGNCGPESLGTTGHCDVGSCVKIDPEPQDPNHRYSCRALAGTTEYAIVDPQAPALNYSNPVVRDKCEADCTAAAQQGMQDWYGHPPTCSPVTGGYVCSITKQIGTSCWHDRADCENTRKNTIRTNPAAICTVVPNSAISQSCQIQH